MKRHALVKTFVTGVFLALCVAGTASQLAAEPVGATTSSSGGSNLALADQPKEVTDALERFKDRDFEGTLKLLREAVKKSADLPPAQVIMAQLFSQAGAQLGPANAQNLVREALDKAVSDAPNDPEPYTILADLAQRDRRLTEARMLYQKAAELMANFNSSTKRKGLLQPRIAVGLVSIDEAQGKWADAQKGLEAWLRFDPKNSGAMQRLARCLFLQKNPDAALEKLREAAKADAEAPVPEAVLAQFCEQAGDRENAKKWLADALKKAPKDIRTHLLASQFALGAEKLPEAEKEAATALQINPRSMEAMILAGAVAMFKKDYVAAEHYFGEANAQSPRYFPASNNLALVLVEQKDEGKKSRALKLAESNRQQYPRSAEAASTHGWVLYKLGRLDEAEKALDTAKSAGYVAPDTAYYLACLCYDRGRESQAKQWLDMAIKSTNPFAMRQEAKALMEKLKK
jgi:Tfp pilus assembly protein PilF